MHINTCHRYFLSNFYESVGPHGLELLGPLWNPGRLIVNTTLLAFMFVVPLLYGLIFCFRRAHDVTVLGK